MAVYKIPQDVEADDKFVGPLSFKQFIYSGIAVISAYLTFLSLTKGFWPALFFFVPIITVAGFLGFPWGRDQPTEIWLAARIRFFLKPRRRIWNQSGIKDLVTVTAPKHIEKHYTDGLNPNEVSSRLSGLADLLDSRGWAVKNVNVNLYSNPVVNGAAQEDDDRLLTVATLPQEVVDVTANDDVLDERVSPTAQHFEEMIRASEQKHRQEIQQQLAAVREIETPAPAEQGNADFWFLQKGGHNEEHQNANQILEELAAKQQAEPAQVGFTTFQAPAIVAPHGVAPTVMVDETAAAAQSVSPLDEQALLAKIHKERSEPFVPFNHGKTIQPLGQTPPAPPQLPIPPVTPPVDPAIMNLANNDDLNVATLARQAEKRNDERSAGDEVVISLR